MYKGNLIKLSTSHTTPVSYTLKLSDEQIDLNSLLGKTIKIEFAGKINCMGCGKQTKTSFAQGYCYNCFQTSPETEECILRPELCRAHLGEGRDPEWAKEHHLQPHIVYIAYSSNIKVGVTRETQIPTRWIDQGASKAMPFLKTPNRHIAGVAEVYLKQKFSDKTNWRKMLAPAELIQPDMNEEVSEALNFLPSELKKYHYVSEGFEFEYPVKKYPDSPKTVSLDKKTIFEGTLVGIKGQYLIFESGDVMNLRKHNGYEVTFSWL